MLLGCIADDFTGAGDLANTLARGGMRTRLFIGSEAVTGGVADAGVVALKTRSLPVPEAIEQSLAALDALQAAGCRQFLFKYCSTFDSTAAGNIGPVAQALARRLETSRVIVCPAFPANGRTVYQGHLFVGDKLLSESGMERHPLTPMTDPDIRRWLALQCDAAPGHIALATVRAGGEALERALRNRSELLVVVDAVSDEDLHMIGHAARDHLLLTGGSGIALGLPENFLRAGLLDEREVERVSCAGNALVLSGSCSTATREQVEQYRGRHPSYEIDPHALLSGAEVLAEAEAFAIAHADKAPLIYSTADPDKVREAQSRHGAERSSAAIERLLGDLAKSAVERGVARLVVAGGETSGAVVSALGLRQLSIGNEIDPGAPALGTVTAFAKPLALALKSGNFGSADFFEKALSMLEGGR